MTETQRHIQKEGYLALCVSILGECGPDLAFTRLESGHEGKGQGNHFWGRHRWGGGKLTEQDTADMAQFRDEGVTLDEIGLMYDLTRSAVLKRVKAWREARGEIKPKSAGYLLTENDTVEMMRLRAQGMTLREVSGRYGVDCSVVSNRIKRLRAKMGDANATN